MELMGIMTEKQNRDIETRLGNKLNDVKNEMAGAIQTVAGRQDTMEKEQQSMRQQMEEMKEQMVDIKKIAMTSQAGKDDPTFAEVLQRPRPAETGNTSTF